MVLSVGLGHSLTFIKSDKQSLKETNPQSEHTDRITEVSVMVL